MPNITINQAGKPPLVLEQPDQVEAYLARCEEALELLIPELENEDVERVAQAFARYDGIHVLLQQIKDQIPAFNAQLTEDYKAQARLLANELRQRKSG